MNIAAFACQKKISDGLIIDMKNMLTTYLNNFIYYIHFEKMNKQSTYINQFIYIEVSYAIQHQTITKLLIILSLFIQTNTTIAQNLVKNGSFEDHLDANQVVFGTIRDWSSCGYCLYGKYPSHVKYWENGGRWGPLWDDRYSFKNEVPWEYTQVNHIRPQDRHSMIAMYYSPQAHRYGSATHLTAWLLEPIEVGGLYEVKFWLYIDKPLRFQDPEWARHIGIALLPAHLDLSGIGKTTRHLSSLCIDTVIYNTWYEVKWQIRPLCNNQYLTIGVFASLDWPIKTGYKASIYYIDNVSVKKLLSADSQSDTIYNYCSKYNPADFPTLKVMFEDVHLYFASNDFALSDKNTAVLDSVARYMRSNKTTVFEISGFADSIGNYSENLVLSENRVQSVMGYLSDSCGIELFRLISKPYGEAVPVKGNETEEERRLNRRVDIQESSIELPCVFYRNALEALKEPSYAKALKHLDQWLQSASAEKHIVMLFDPRLAPLHPMEGWTFLVRKIKKNYSKLKYANYAFILDSLLLSDKQTYEGEMVPILNALTCAAKGEAAFPFSLSVPPTDSAFAIRRQHYEIFRQIVEKTGWPKKSDFGQVAASSVVLVLHSGDSLAYTTWLPHLERACKAGESSWKGYAMLYDRCRLVAGKPQYYGTHSKIKENGEIALEPCEGNLEAVNERRVTIGLSVLSE